ncbi:XRE family transcriptional regulator [Oceanobacillus profundus]|uniref:helix-turn-helix domain-containing protein n=1 Tax=Oceanobacillus TaxID=182709 RepID=UPI000BA6E53C|nr:XRE family transcriptional regulator [Oceanobacillus profundus]MBR3118938.1 helix-turn-helix transcriptional regulator [Oceanobacillus sp.]MCM3400421.1 XRE family transcriptional regulator [Oceanobacillus profundus]MDO6450925.1 XRE family transcriptional regulator [Oceanobacillus profundus]PAE27854.1 transcriptional regulator [Paenibacillus sp. 7884-2]
MTIEKPWSEEDVGKRIGANLRKYRTSKGLSMEAFAKQIGVSKLTLIKVEHGEANPTLSVIWKIADGLKISITELLEMESDVSIIRKGNGVKLSSSDKLFVAEPLFRSRSFELYRGYLQGRSEYVSEAHQPGVIEFVTVMSGELTMELDGEVHHLNAFDSIRFKGDRLHKYVNPSSSVSILHFAITYNNH